MDRSPSINLKKIEALSDTAVRFIKIFVRAEFALKEAGFIFDRHGSAQADWNRFAGELGAPFWECVFQSEMADTLINRPPSKQIVEGGSLGWREASNSLGCIHELIGAVRRVRNNLLHGGKSGDKDSDRNEALISEAMFVLIAAIKAVENVEIHFVGDY